jgi:hypothetical protein
MSIQTASNQLCPNSEITNKQTNRLMWSEIVSNDSKHRYTLLVDGWNELPLDELDVVDSEASTLAYVVDLTVAMRETDSERDPVGIRGICDMQ